MSQSALIISCDTLAISAVLSRFSSGPCLCTTCMACASVSHSSPSPCAGLPVTIRHWQLRDLMTFGEDSSGVYAVAGASVVRYDLPSHSSSTQRGGGPEEEAEPSTGADATAAGGLHREDARIEDSGEELREDRMEGQRGTASLVAGAVPSSMLEAGERGGAAGSAAAVGARHSRGDEGACSTTVMRPGFQPSCMAYRGGIIAAGGQAGEVCAVLAMHAPCMRRVNSMRPCLVDTPSPASVNSTVLQCLLRIPLIQCMLCVCSMQPYPPSLEYGGLSLRNSHSHTNVPMCVRHTVHAHVPARL